MANSDPPSSSSSSAKGLPAQQRLGSWKEIANYLGRTVRTVQRWEQNEGLPVRRLQHDSGSTVFAFQHELDRWMTRRSLVVHAKPGTSTPVERPAQKSETEVKPPSPNADTSNQKTASKPAIWLFALAAIALLTTLLTLQTPDDANETMQHDLPRSLTTEPGIERFPALSPDGKRVVYAWTDEGGQDDLFLRLVDVEEYIRLTNDDATEESPVWSPDGLYIAFLKRAGSNTRELRIMPAIGGNERLVATLPMPPTLDAARSIAASVAWSPDGQWLVTNRGQNNPEVMGLVAININTGKEYLLTWPDAEAADLSPEFSPDGRYIAFARSPSALRASIHVMEFDSEAPGKSQDWMLPAASPFNVDPAWTIDGEGLVFSSGRWPRMRLFHVPADGSAEPAPLTGTGQGGSQPSIARLNDQGVSSEAWRMVYMVQALENDIWRINLDRSDEVALLSSSQRERFPSWSGDGRIAFLSDRSGHREAWVADDDGKNWQQWTDWQSAYVWRPTFSPDNQLLAYTVEIDHALKLYVQDSPLAPARLITPDDAVDQELAWSNDGKRLYTLSPNRGGGPGLWAIDLNGNPPRRLAEGALRPLAEDPSGRSLMAIRSTPAGTRLERIDLQSGELVTIELSGTEHASFTGGPDGVYFVTRIGEALEIHRWDWLTDEQISLVQLRHTPEIGMAISPDGRHALLSRIVLQRSDLMVLDGTR